MTAPVLYTLTSSLHTGMTPDPRQEPFIQGIEAALGVAFDCRGEDLQTYGSGGTELIYVRTGGTEGAFLQQLGARTFRAPVRLLTSGRSNSLAASMEILSWLRARGFEGEILHGSEQDIAARIRSLSDGQPDVSQSPDPTEPYPWGPLLAGKRYGVIGKPSDWLIASDVDYAAVRERLGAQLLDIPIDELVEEVRRGGAEQPEGLPLKALNIPRYGHESPSGDFRDALTIYGALRRLVRRYSLDGLTLRCFDLLTALHNTGCLALAILNAEGITATCEGDIPAMLSMAVAQARTARASFQVNLSRIEGDCLLFAHCTVPLSIVRDYCYDTHFESGIGVAIHGELPEEGVTLFKLSPDCRRMYRKEALLLGNPYEGSLCRTQVIVRALGAADYFLRCPIGNHHIIVPGNL